MAVAIIGPKFYAWDRNGKPLAFGKVYTYQARTNSPKPTYQSEDAIVENTNPVILNGEGYANIYLDGSYKVVVKDKDENEIWTADPVSAAQATEWVNCMTAGYVSTTEFQAAGNVTEVFDQGRRLRLDQGGSDYDYTSVASSSYAGGFTKVTVTTGIITVSINEVCTSIVGQESSNQAAYSRLSFNTVQNMIDGIVSGGETIDFEQLAAQRSAVSTKSFRFNIAGEMPIGGGDYVILTASDYGGIPDGKIVAGKLYGADHYVGGGTDYVAKLIREGTVAVTKYGAFGDNSNDDFEPVQLAIKQNDSVGFSNLKYKIGTSLDATDRFNGVKLIGEHSGIANGGAVLYGETGERAVIDFAGSQKVVMDGVSVQSGTDNPSKLGLLFSRSSTSQFSQFNELNSLRVSIDSDPSAFGGAGTLGIMIKAAEIFTLNNVYSLADTGGAIVDSDNRWNIVSDYKTLTGVPTSNSTYKISGNTVFDSRNEVGVPLYCKAVVNLEGMCYVNGDVGTGGDTFGLEVEGINSGWNFTIFTEFAKRHAKMFCTFKESVLNIMGSYGPNRNIDTTTDFTGWTNVEVNFINTISGAFTSPDYWIEGSSSDVMSNVRVSAPQEPAVAWVAPANQTFNLKNGFHYQSPTNTRLSRNQLQTPFSEHDKLPVRLGNYRQWVGTNGVALQKTSDPASDLDGTGIGFGGSQSTVGAAGGASVLPATPTGYIETVVNGVEVVIPYYNKS